MRTIAATLCIAIGITLNTGFASAESPYYVSPFDQIYDTINQKTIRNFELLPKIDDADLSKYNSGTKSEAVARDAVMSGNISKHSFLRHHHKKTLGKHTVELFGPALISGKRIYFWVVKGQINHYNNYWGEGSRKQIEPPKDGYIHNYAYI